MALFLQGVHSGLESRNFWKSLKMSHFSEFGKTIGISPAFAEKAGLLFLGLIVRSGINLMKYDLIEK